MNKDLEKQIEEAAYNNTELLMFWHNSLETKTMAKRFDSCFVKGAKSPEAKEYWQHGMYFEEEVKELLKKYLLEQCASKWEIPYDEDWFEQNKKK